MNGRKLVLEFGGSQILLFVESPVGLDPIDDYREVNFELPGKGQRRAVFFFLPDKNSDDPYATKPAHEWEVPVLWEDPTMLYIPSLSDESILAAIKHVLENGLEDDAFENEEDIRMGGE